MECLVDFHGTSPRSSCEIIHVMISCANLNMIQMSQCVTFVLFFNQPPHHNPTIPSTTTTTWRPMPTTTPFHLAPMTTQKMKLMTHRWRWPPTYEDEPWPAKTNHDNPPQLANDGQHPCTETGNDEPRWVSSPPPLSIISLTQVPHCWQWCGNQTIHHNKGMAMTTP